MMDFNEVIQQRRSVRHYREEPLSQDILDRLYRALQVAPSTANKQERSFYFVQDFERRKAIVTRACHNQMFILEAPLILVATCRKDYAIDLAIAVDHLVLAATNEGLGTCWISWFEQERVKEILGIPETRDVPVLVPIGYAAESPPARTRKALGDLIIRV